jgi:UDP:flavonoid glycosyltransferase YjiC (YdhE family)
VQRSSLVICNGGSLTTYQALSSGVPILGLCANMDQLLNMNAIERLGAGLTLRAARVLPDQLQVSAQKLLDSPVYAQAAAQAGRRFGQVDAGQRFRQFVDEVVA